MEMKSDRGDLEGVGTGRNKEETGKGEGSRLKEELWRGE